MELVGHKTSRPRRSSSICSKRRFLETALFAPIQKTVVLTSWRLCFHAVLLEKSFLITKVTTELFLRGRLDGKIAIIVSTAMDELDAYRQTFTVSTAIKEVEIVLGKYSRNLIFSKTSYFAVKVKFIISDTHEFSLIDFSKAQVILTLPKTVKKLFEYIRRSNRKYSRL
jgi:hypothetical protein